MAMVGMNPADTTLVGFMSAYLYGFIMLVFPMVFSILCANRLIAQQVDRGSMAYLLAAPVKRSSVAFTQMKVLAGGIFALVAYATVLGVVSCEAFFPGNWKSGNFCCSMLVFCACSCSSAGSAFLLLRVQQHEIQRGVWGRRSRAGVCHPDAGQCRTRIGRAKYATFFTLIQTASPPGKPARCGAWLSSLPARCCCLAERSRFFRKRICTYEFAIPHLRVSCAKSPQPRFFWPGPSLRTGAECFDDLAAGLVRQKNTASHKAWFAISAAAAGRCNALTI